MKKIICIVLALSFLFVQTSAMAETGYLSLKAAISSVAGEGFSTSIEDSIWLRSTVYISFMPEGETSNLILMGYNGANKPEGTAWYVDEVTLLGTLAAFCMNWSTFHNGLDAGYSLTIAYYPSADDDPTLITTEAEAALIGQLFESLFE